MLLFIGSHFFQFKPILNNNINNCLNCKYIIISLKFNVKAYNMKTNIKQKVSEKHNGFVRILNTCFLLNFTF